MIRSTFSGFTMAQQALMASQYSIDVAGQNLSNIYTEGYTRQRLDLASITPEGMSNASSHTFNKVGQGVMMTGVTQIRDPYLDIQYRNQIAKVGTADATDVILEQLGQVFDETDSTAIRSALNDVISQLNSLATTATSGEEANEAVIRSSFEVLFNLVQQNANQLDAIEEGVVDKLKDTIEPTVNDILKDLTSLNETIKNTQVLGSPALELMDQRNSLLDDLATYLPIEVSYSTSNIGGIEVDEMKVSFTDSDGNEHVLVEGVEAGSVSFDATTGVPYAFTITDIHGTTSADVADKLVNGVIKGNLDMLNKGEGFDDPVTDTRGIPYYREMFDSFVNTMATTLNTMNGSNGALFSTSDGATDFTASNIMVSDEWKNGSVTLKRATDTGAGSTSYDNILKMINALSEDVFEVKNASGDTILNGTIQDIYDNLQNVQAIDRKSVSTILDNHITVLNQISTSKESISGVNQDEEVMNLMKFQQSYNAASRLMTTMDEMLNTLINNTGVVGR